MPIHLGAIPAGLLANRDFAECVSADAPGSQIPDDLRTLLYDPQTAGGLLISVASDNADALLDSLRSAGLNAAKIGSVLGPYAAGTGYAGHSLAVAAKSRQYTSTNSDRFMKRSENTTSDPEVTQPVQPAAFAQ